ncbi:Retrovirus-related Pol polyprotein from transposon RE2 [Sesamum angolense]|uniref:Retrovirus-related Pol polyprotein from transposon RE2 n=1 Tax=Sesamum angolense TaxID=2727404 RepID=A0AAE2C3M6_9LAMI|nr:Retrovirus-related Pol polyprotein from transposon RE2 [Sesamum angolense]
MGKRKVTTTTTNTESPLLPQLERAKEKGRLEVLERSRKLSKDEMAQRLGDGKAIAAEAGYALETAVKLLNMEPSKAVPQTPYEIWHGTPSSYKYLRVWGSLAYVKRLIGDKLDLRSSEPPQQNDATSFEPSVPINGAPVLRRTYGEAMSDIDSDKWLEAMEFEMDSMGSNQVWILVDPPKGVKSVGCKLVYKRKIRADGEVTSFKAKLVAKGYTQRPRVDFEETYSPSKQATTVDSTTEAKYIAASEVAKETVWMKNYIQELGIVTSIVEPVVIFFDNNGAIAQVKEPRSHHHSKRILRRYHLFREMVSSYGNLAGLVYVTCVPNFDILGIVLRLEGPQQSRAYDDYTLDLCEM